MFARRLPSANHGTVDTNNVQVEVEARGNSKADINTDMNTDMGTDNASTTAFTAFTSFTACIRCPHINHRLWSLLFLIQSLMLLFGWIFPQLHQVSQASYASYATFMTTQSAQFTGDQQSQLQSQSQSQSQSDPINSHADLSLPPPPQIADEDVCELAKHNFTAASGLFCIVTGMEHSGTTIMVQFLTSPPNLFGGLECGLLTMPTPAEFNTSVPFYDWMGRTTHFGLTPEIRDEILLSASCPAQMYQRIRQHSTFFGQSPHPSQQTSWIVDKTPRYIRMLDEVMSMTPGVPVIVTRKNALDQIRSIVKHMDTNDFFKDMSPKKKRRRARVAVERARVSLKRAMDRHGSSGRILIVNATELYSNPDVVMSGVFDFLRLNWKTEYLSMDALNVKRQMVGINNNLTSFDRNALQNKHITQKVEVGRAAVEVDEVDEKGHGGKGIRAHP